jgi:hypothetical protein
MENNDIKSLAARIEKLEQVVFGGGKNSRPKKLEKPTEDFSGPTGGIRLLISKKFFETKRGLSDVRKGISDQGYHYSVQAVQTGLNRLSKLGGPLVAFREGGKKIYAKRK